MDNRLKVCKDEIACILSYKNPARIIQAGLKIIFLIEPGILQEVPVTMAAMP